LGSNTNVKGEAPIIWRICHNWRKNLRILL
jgi:hypothetical protein